ncbi:hypothetical protein [Candidatus Phytoplasma bonamiae]|uniref:Uncharacterized protein n=1 Tax=Candidatus Phytoplasma bonamiae TaxID=2982626 RepID=A0ABT9D3J0_9MOLU|nr:hypothetical protein ['Bonamia sp.' little leaf phytoplasma]MDO8063983.1 hypothetical protein ['Bonamia sp.' little leaf phytoplasma]MDV3174496.1 hypothetical protein ['Bonamia sp.' little leaf phytoplasma]
MSADQISPRSIGYLKFFSEKRTMDNHEERGNYGFIYRNPNLSQEQQLMLQNKVQELKNMLSDSEVSHEDMNEKYSEIKELIGLDTKILEEVFFHVTQIADRSVIDMTPEDRRNFFYQGALFEFDVESSQQGLKAVRIHKIF